MEVFRVSDFETTGFTKKGEVEEQAHQVVEAGFFDVCGVSGTRDMVLGPSAQSFFKPTRPIELGARATHHITDHELEKGQPQENLNDFMHIGDPHYFVFHNAAFDATFFDLRDVRLICTYKCAIRAWPDCPSHSNQVLRYYHGMDLNTEKFGAPHRALPDAYVTAHILIELLKVYAPAKLTEWTSLPRLITKCPVGIHYGKPWADVPGDYLNWMLRTDFEEDVKYNIREEMERRRKAPQRPHPEYSR